jgi:hypothetical protein
MRFTQRFRANLNIHLRGADSYLNDVAICGLSLEEPSSEKTKYKLNNVFRVMGEDANSPVTTIPRTEVGCVLRDLEQATAAAAG